MREAVANKDRGVPKGLPGCFAADLCFYVFHAYVGVSGAEFRRGSAYQICSFTIILDDLVRTKQLRNETSTQSSLAPAVGTLAGGNKQQARI